MTSLVANIMDLAVTDTFETVKIGVVAYFGLLWLAVIIWVTKDALQRSSSVLFQAFAILLNILIPFLGVLLYMIIRPAKTRMETYYEELERNMLEGGEVTDTSVCEKCLTPVDKEYSFCPNCAQSLKKSCAGCKHSFPNLWNICPFCGKEYKDETQKESHKAHKSHKK